MSAEKVQELRDRYNECVWAEADVACDGYGEADTEATEAAWDALIAAVREDEKQKCIAAVMARRPDISYDRDDEHVNQGISLALEAIRNV